MGLPRLRVIAVWTVLIAVPLWAVDADSGIGILHSSGTTWINGSAVPKSSAVFSGDLVQTQPGSLASINSPGSNVTMFADSLLKYGERDVVLQHGTITV